VRLHNLLAQQSWSSTLSKVQPGLSGRGMVDSGQPVTAGVRYRQSAPRVHAQAEPGPLEEPYQVRVLARLCIRCCRWVKIKEPLPQTRIRSPSRHPAVRGRPGCARRRSLWCLGPSTHLNPSGKFNSLSRWVRQPHIQVMYVVGSRECSNPKH
jgi:hypothetical protein